MIKYKIKRILNARGEQWYFEIHERGWKTFFAWKFLTTRGLYDTAKLAIGNRKHHLETWSYEGGDGVLKFKNKIL